MRLIRNIILLILLLILILWLASYLSPFLTRNSSDAEALKSIQFKQASVKIAYTLNQDVWLEFQLQPGEDQVRIMSNAILDENYQVLESERFLYAIDYEVLDDKGNVIKPGRFYHRGAQKHYIDTDTAQTYVSTSVYPATENPLDSRIHMLNLRGLKNAEKIRLKPAEYQYPIQKIVVRGYQKKKITERKLDYAWQRMGDERRQSLAKVSVYNADIISEQEKRQLVKNQWAPLGPLGVDNEDYFIQKLYVVREVENDVQLNVAAVPSSGMVIYPGRYGMITLPENDNAFKLSWKLFTGGSNKAEDVNINVEWWGRPATRYKKWTQKLSKGFLNQKIDSGVIRLSADQPIVVRAWLTNSDDNNDIEITPKPAYLRLFSPASPGLVYKVNHVRGFKTPYRFDIRAFGEQRSSSLKYQLLDKYDRTIKTGSITLASELSAYDSVVADADRWLTEAQHVYFNLPRRVSKVRFDAVPGIWISAFTRPKNLAHTTVDPVAVEDLKLVVPVWFAVRPEQWKSYLLKGRSQLITIQRHPPEIDKKLLMGQYYWQQFLPEGVWKGRNILTALEGEQQFREEAISSRYIKVKSAIENPINFISKFASNSLRPTLLYSRDNADSVEMLVWLDDKVLYKTLLVEKNGEIQLPYITAGQHRLRLEVAAENSVGENDKTEFYINYTNGLSNVSLKRMGIYVPDDGLKFKLPKEQANELLAVRIYTPQSTNNTFDLKIKVNGIDGRPIGPLPDWTIGRRVYQMSPVENVNLPLIFNTNETLGTERLFFVPLGADMPVNNDYQIELNVNPSISAYVVLTRTIPGLYPSRMLYPDIELEDAK